MSLLEQFERKAERTRDESAVRIARTPLYFASGNRQVFGWYHSGNAAPAKNCTVVICNPLGYEYTHSYRSLRRLADQLASVGISTLRFEYSATGNSSDDDLTPALMQCWLEDIRAAVATAKSLSGNSDVCLLGVRMGATLAAQIANEQSISYLAMWNPCVNGRHYVREMIALASAAADAPLNSAGIESAGFVLSNETADELKRINLLTTPIAPNCKVLLLQRDDLAFDLALETYLRDLGIEVTQSIRPGFADMMAEPQFTNIPTAAIDSIVEWLSGHCKAITTSPPHDIDNSRAPLEAATTHENGVQLTEQICRFGSENHLFGVLSFITAQTAKEKPAIIFLNSGSVHQVGPNRLYVTLARQLATLGHTCLRFDLQGLGDSQMLQEGIENHPYPSTFIQDTAAALKYLSLELGCTEFILIGLCSGAHNSFHAAIELTEFNIVEAILINPLTFKYVEGMTLETTRHFLDVAYYKKSARSVNSWLKLLRGKVDITNLFKIAISQTKVMLESFDKYIRESVFNKATTQLSADLRRLFARKIPLSLFVSANDPGYSILTWGAQFMTKKGSRSGWIRVQFIPDADHTFSRLTPRQEMIDRVYTHIKNCYSAAE